MPSKFTLLSKRLESVSIRPSYGLISTIATSARHYQPSALDNIEVVEEYRKGGFHPVHLGDSFASGRYHVLHKLGFGGFSTVWLARDERLRRLVALKIITAEASSRCVELKILRHLNESSIDHPGRSHIISVLDHFNVQGPNGSHACLVSQLAGPSVTQICDSPGQVAGSRRLRGALARRLAKQVTQAIGYLHFVGIVHGDLTPSNVLLRLANMDSWSMEELYERLGHPMTDKIVALPGTNNSLSAPDYLVEPLDLSRIHSSYFSGDALLVDFGHSFMSDSPPPEGVGTPLSYCSPEALFDIRASVWSDIWALGCTIFEIRAGSQLFASFLGGPDEVIRQMVQTLGKLPEPWWSAWEQRSAYFDKNGRPKRTWENDIPLAVEYPLVKQIRDIGAEDEVDEDESPVETIMEAPGTRLSEAEVLTLEDLMHGTIAYVPEQRMPADKAAIHPWFTDVCG